MTVTDVRLQLTQLQFCSYSLDEHTREHEPTPQPRALSGRRRGATRTKPSVT